MIYPVDSVIQPFNDRGQEICRNVETSFKILCVSIFNLRGLRGDLDFSALARASLWLASPT